MGHLWSQLIYIINTLPETNSHFAPELQAQTAPQGDDRIPTCCNSIHFQVRAVGFREGTTSHPFFFELRPASCKKCLYHQSLYGVPCNVLGNKDTDNSATYPQNPFRNVYHCIAKEVSQFQCSNLLTNIH